MSVFKTGFCKGDVVTETNERYIRVLNNNKTFVVGDNGERRQWKDNKFIPSLNKPSLKGSLSLDEL